MIVGSLPTTMAEYRKALEAARTEGRQQAVHEIRLQVGATGIISIIEVHRILDRVAGLNASEADR